jgi:hypothetical protein
MAIVGGAAHREALKKTAAAQKVQDMKRDTRRSLQQGVFFMRSKSAKPLRIMNWQSWKLQERKLYAWRELLLTR